MTRREENCYDILPMTLPKTIVKVPNLRRKPGHLYYISTGGNLMALKRNPGHVLGRVHTPTMARRLGIKKVPGYLYYLKGDTIMAARMMNARRRKKS